FKSCDVLPALAEAIQTTPPMEITRALYAFEVHPTRRKATQVAIMVAMAMPEMGLEEVPIRPVIRDETVTNRKPNTTTKIAAAILATTLGLVPGTGLKVRYPIIMIRTSTVPARACFKLRSLSVRLVPRIAVAPFFKSAAPARKAFTIVGMVLIRVIRPAAATAPAPIGRM